MRSGGKEMGQKIKHERQLNLKREVHVRMLEGGGGKRLGLGVFFPLYYAGSHVDTERIIT